MTDPLFTFDKSKHIYKYDGKRVTGVTTVIGMLAKPNLIPWAARMACEYIREHVEYAIPGTDGGFWAIKPSTVEEAQKAHTKKKEAAGTHGTDAHALVEEYIGTCIQIAQGKPDVLANFHEIDKFIEWAKENVDHFLFSERKMFNKELFIAGTADFAAVMKNGKRIIFDFKTASGSYGIDFWLQTAAYRMLAEAEGDEPYDGCGIVRLGKKGPTDFDVSYVYDYETYKKAFLACLTLYRAQGALKDVLIKDV